MKGLLGEANRDLARRSIGPSLLSFDMVVIVHVALCCSSAFYLLRDIIMRHGRRADGLLAQGEREEFVSRGRIFPLC